MITKCEARATEAHWNGRDTALIRTLIAGMTALPLEGLVAILSREPDIEPVATVREAEVVPTARTLQPDVALLAPLLPADGEVAAWIAVAARAREAVPDCQYAILASTWRCCDLQSATAAGVRGLLVGDSPPGHLAAAVRLLAAGQQVVDSRLSLTTSSPLTTREAQMLRAAANGWTTAEIGAETCLSAGTVRNYLSRAISKTGARNRQGAIRMATDSGWI
jgi:two-component system response regulator DesR